MIDKRPVERWGAFLFRSVADELIQLFRQATQFELR